MNKSKTVLKKDYDKLKRELKDFHEISLKYEKYASDLKDEKQDLALKLNDVSIRFSKLKDACVKSEKEADNLAKIIVQLNLEKYLDD